MNPEFDLRSQVSILGLFHRLQDIIGVSLRIEFLDKFSLDEYGLYALNSLVLPSDLADMFPIVKGK
jgi:hypothetical protein